MSAERIALSWLQPSWLRWQRSFVGFVPFHTQMYRPGGPPLERARVRTIMGNSGTVMSHSLTWQQSCYTSLTDTGFGGEKEGRMEGHRKPPAKRPTSAVEPSHSYLRPFFQPLGFISQSVWHWGSSSSWFRVHCDWIAGEHPRMHLLGPYLYFCSLPWWEGGISPLRSCRTQGLPICMFFLHFSMRVCLLYNKDRVD